MQDYPALGAAANKPNRTSIPASRRKRRKGKRKPKGRRLDVSFQSDYEPYNSTVRRKTRRVLDGPTTPSSSEDEMFAIPAEIPESSPLYKKINPTPQPVSPAQNLQGPSKRSSVVSKPKESLSTKETIKKKIESSSQNSKKSNKKITLKLLREQICTYLKNNDGVDLTSLASLFSINYKKFGFAKLKDFLQAIPQVEVYSPKQSRNRCYVRLKKSKPVESKKSMKPSATPKSKPSKKSLAKTKSKNTNENLSQARNPSAFVDNNREKNVGKPRTEKKPKASQDRKNPSPGNQASKIEKQRKLRKAKRIEKKKRLPSPPKLPPASRDRNTEVPARKRKAHREFLYDWRRGDTVMVEVGGYMEIGFVRHVARDGYEVEVRGTVDFYYADDVLESLNDYDFHPNPDKENFVYWHVEEAFSKPSSVLEKYWEDVMLEYERKNGALDRRKEFHRYLRKLLAVASVQERHFADLRSILPEECG